MTPTSSKAGVWLFSRASRVSRLTRQRTLELSHPLQPLASFHSSPRPKTDGVFRELTESRVQTPWIQALRRQQQEGHDPTKASSQPQTPTNRNLEPKRMSDSFHSVVLPLARDPWLLDTYLNSSGHIRLGTIFMDLDALSGIIAYKHTGDDVTTVTAAVDRIVINHPLTEICDLELSGQVTYATGRSSMEVSLQVAKMPKNGERPGKEDIMMTCGFTMVSLDLGTKKPVAINPIKAETEEERRLFEAGERNSKRRKESSQKSLLRTVPNDEESDLIHAMWQKQLQYHDPNDPLRQPHNVHSMSTTSISSTAIMQPQFRNRHHFMIFGGFLLKSTFELAFCCAAAFSHSRPVFVSLDPSDFKHPVPVGSVLYLTATVVYNEPSMVGSKGTGGGTSSTEDGKAGSTRVQVRVDSKVRDVEHGDVKPTGQFNYTFSIPKDIKIMPRTYTEFMMWVDARRRSASVLESLEAGSSESRDRVTE
ncbi:MAG: hypothetical protein M1820_009307 [Bogoriella megaspora]|nr:MAG: hypothetical protein M1820_009307 [Bogoriella megaspora]